MVEDKRTAPPAAPEKKMNTVVSRRRYLKNNVLAMSRMGGWMGGWVAVYGTGLFRKKVEGGGGRGRVQQSKTMIRAVTDGIRSAR